MGGAGESRREYERRRRKDREARHRNFERSLVFVLLTPLVVYGLVQPGAWAINQWLLSSMLGKLGVSGAREVTGSRRPRTSVSSSPGSLSRQ